MFEPEPTPTYPDCKVTEVMELVLATSDGSWT